MSDYVELRKDDKQGFLIDFRCDFPNAWKMGYAWEALEAIGLFPGAGSTGLYWDNTWQICMYINGNDANAMCPGIVDMLERSPLDAAYAKIDDAALRRWERIEMMASIED